jgi:hypothetical protein
MTFNVKQYFGVFLVMSAFCDLKIKLRSLLLYKLRV